MSPRAGRTPPRWTSLVDALTNGHTPTPPAGVADALAYTYGTGRGGRANTRAAAAALGVSQRTVQRWMRQPPTRSPHVDELRRQAAAAADTAPRRREALNRRREARIRHSGAQVKLTARTRVSDDRRDRDITYRFTGEQLEPVMQAYLDGGEQAARAALGDLFRDHYGGVGIEAIEAVEFKR